MPNINLPPGTYFISHSYKDAKIRDRMIKKLPKGIKPYIFPPISVSPKEFVSNKLIEAIMDCQGLIYLDGGYSSKSFWVAFERDYAMRAKKKVYSYNPENNSFAISERLLLDLQVFVSCTRADREIVNKVIEHMRMERFFDVDDYQSLDYQRIPSEKRSRSSIVEKLNRGGYLVSFWTAKAAKSEFSRFEIEFAYDYGHQLTLNSDNPNNDRLLIALLDNTPLPSWLQDRLADKNLAIQPIQIYGDKELSMTNRIDNLVVCLYWLIYRNQFPDLVEE